MLVVIVALVLGRYVNSHAQRLLRWMIAAGVIGPVLLGLTTPTALFGALSLGLFSVALVRLVYGSPEGLPSIERLQTTLDGAGIAVADLAYRDEQPGTVGLATAVRRPTEQRIEHQDLWHRRREPTERRTGLAFVVVPNGGPVTSQRTV